MKISKKILIGVIIGSLLITGTAFAKKIEENIKVRFANIQMIVNGKPISSKAEPFIFNGSVYAPVATIANMLGIKQEWDNTTPSVRFTDDLRNTEITQAERPEGLFYLDFNMALKLVEGSTSGTNTSFQIFNHTTKSKGQVIPRIEMAGYLNLVEPITPFIKYTGGFEKNEFLLKEHLYKEGDSQYWISLFRYDKAKDLLTKIHSQRIDEERDKGLFHEIIFDTGITIKMYDISNETRKLVGVKWYIWKEGQFVKSEELVK